MLGFFLIDTFEIVSKEYFFSMICAHHNFCSFTSSSINVWERLLEFQELSVFSECVSPVTFLKHLCRLALSLPFHPLWKSTVLGLVWQRMCFVRACAWVSKFFCSHSYFRMSQFSKYFPMRFSFVLHLTKCMSLSITTCLKHLLFCHYHQVFINYTCLFSTWIPTYEK